MAFCKDFLVGFFKYLWGLLLEKKRGFLCFTGEIHEYARDKMPTFVSKEIIL